MKKSLQPRARPPLPLLIALAALVTQWAVAQVANTLTLEENSSSNSIFPTLTATYTPAAPTTTIFNVTFAGPDNWFIGPAGFVSLATGTNTWVEPDNSSLSNVLTPLGGTTGQTFRVQSDIATVGSIQDEGTAFNVGLDLGNNLPVNVVFDDDAATVENQTVPDTGSTLGLLFLALAALFGANRLRSIRLA